LRRSTNEKMIAGVAGGVAEYVGIDPNIARLGFAALTVFGGSGPILYLVAWLIMPDGDQSASEPPPPAQPWPAPPRPAD
jgi:phage shock protein PspC (stress-responsive transcriptional regulator)